MGCVNSIQIGGEHYRKRQHQPWDLYLKLYGELPIFFLALKYFTRWKEKGGVSDLEKVVHYIDKQMEFSPLVHMGYLGVTTSVMCNFEDIQDIRNYCISNKIEYNLQMALEHLLMADTYLAKHELMVARQYVVGLIRAVDEMEK